MQHIALVQILGPCTLLSHLQKHMGCTKLGTERNMHHHTTCVAAAVRLKY